ncbi:hypothetical protein A5724_32660 [Mycobacterium sp. ACS1612]|nr:hypothetical protein A5724_32660 [Mycobacterium sp. ACS1612]
MVGCPRMLMRMCAAIATVFSRHRGATGLPAVIGTPQWSDSKSPSATGEFRVHVAHALPGRCLPVMFLVSTMSET